MQSNMIISSYKQKALKLNQRFSSGQINGTTGYEEAASQELMAMLIKAAKAPLF